MAQQNSVPAYFTFLILAFTLFMVLYPSASSFLLRLSLMHFLCHFVPQASHVESPALPQMPSSFLVSSVSQLLSQRVYFFQVRKLFKTQLLYCQKAEAFPPPL